MKKYIVTEKHPVFKEGCIIKKSGTIETDKGHCTCTTYNLICNGVFIDHILDLPIAENIEDGWIEEIQKPEFTKDDMIEFAKKCGCESPYSAYNINIIPFFVV